MTVCIGAAALVSAAWLVPRFSSRTTHLLATSDIGQRSFLVAAALTVGLAAYLRLLPLLNRPLPYAADIERLYRMHAFSTWDHLLNPQDYHHPGLWFGLLHWPFELSGQSFLVPATFGRVCAVLTVAMVGLMVSAYAGRLAALAAMLNVALLPFLATHARALSDVTLFILLGVVSLIAYARAREQPSVARLAALGVVLVLAANASYAAPVLVGALLVDAVWRRRRSPALIGTLLAASLTAAPRFWHLARLMPAELEIRSALVRLDVSHWANEPMTSFAGETAIEFLTPAFPYLLLLLLAALWAGRRLLTRRATELAWAALAYVVFLCAQPLIRVKPYYASLFPVILLALVATLAAVRQPGEGMLVAARRRALALVASAGCFVAFASFVMQQHSDPLQAYEVATRDVIQSALDDKATRLASTIWTETTWYFFADPFGTMSGCIRNDPGRRCRPAVGYDEDLASGRRYYALAQGPLPSDDREHSVSELRRIQTDGVTHLFVDSAMPVDAQLVGYAQSHCTKLAQADSFQAWRCPQIDPAVAASDGSP